MISLDRNEQQHLILPIRSYHGEENSPSKYYDSISRPIKQDQDYQNDDDGENKAGISILVMVTCLSMGSFLACLDNSIVFTVMSQIGSEFKQSNLATWIQTIYSLFVVTTLPLLGSAGCGFSQNLSQLIFFRAVAGLGGGGLVFLPDVVIHDIAPLKNRSAFQSYVTCMNSVALALGSPIGGFITNLVGWRYCFHMNVIPLAVSLYIFTFHLKNYRVASMDQIGKVSLLERIKLVDFGGSVLCGIGNAALCTALILGGNTRDWSDPFVVSMMLGAIASFISLALYEVYIPKFPLLPPYLFRNRTVVIGGLGMMLISMLSGGCNISLPQFFMGVLGLSIDKAGLCIAAHTIGVIVGSFAAGWYVQRPRSFRNSGMGIATTIGVGCAFMYFWMLQQISFPVGMLLFTLAGCAIGAYVIIVKVAVPVAVSKADMTFVFMLIQLARHMGTILGVSATSSVTQASLKILLHERFKGPDAEQLVNFIRTSLREVHTLSPKIQAIVADILAISLSRAFILLTGVAVFTTIVFSFVSKSVKNV
ncbi:hypothetical protein LRAMOSA03863 [Lichtheimia ramosa]|uniref:Major facilitator superfamily (MFS) profile domain-containing protein n=1 Tax=Lichtheimia ramosa TaxID=688394 RepID=A0A077WWE1_9FUNG|nr:hypothetical protein LRAMOSA03863 [Lichtheimia ramosa]